MIVTTFTHIIVMLFDRGQEGEEEMRGIIILEKTKKMTHNRSTQPCIPPGLLNLVPASAGVKAGKSPLRLAGNTT